jgi:PKD repeat protein
MKRPADPRLRLMSPRNTRASLPWLLQPRVTSSFRPGIPAGRLCHYLLLSLLAACQSETTTPSTSSNTAEGPDFLITDNVVATLAVNPDSQMVFAGDRFKITSRPKNAAGQLLDKAARWTVTDPQIAKQLDSLKATTSFRALAIGATTIKATIDAKSKFAKVVVRSVIGAKVVLTPAQATVATGGTIQFTATGLTQTGEKSGVNVTWSATGGTISNNGLMKAGTIAGTYRVIATAGFGAADTSVVSITAATTAQAQRVVLLPDIAASRPGAKIQFAATLYSNSGSAVAETPLYTSTCGSISSTGMYTAPTPGSSCSVVASMNERADTTEVVPLANNSQSTPFGIFSLWSTPTTPRGSGVAAFSASHDDANASSIIQQIAAARAQGIHLIFAMTGGSHENYKTNGVFDLSKWRAKMETFNTSAIRSAVAQGVADGTIIGNSVLDEPQQSDRDAGYRTKSWGPSGTMTRQLIDGLCGYAKNIFPTMPVGVFHDPAMFEANTPYRVCEFIMAQYGYRKYNGDVARWRDETLALAKRDGMAVVFSINILNGGKQDKDGVYDCVGSLMGGLGTYKPNCAMTPQQIRDWGKALAASACALMSWRYDATYVGKPQNQAALAEVAIAASNLSRKPCIGSRVPDTPPVAAFTSNCTDLVCSFTNTSSDEDGNVVSQSWDFGDNSSSSTAVSPTHSYSSAGTYKVTLIVTDDRGVTDDVTQTVTVTEPAAANTPPVAGFNFSCTELACGFTDGSTDSDGTVVSWSWTFGDGSSSTEQSPNHSYDQDGSYDVKLVVTDNDGDTGSQVQTVTVSGSTAATGGP